MIKEDPYQTLYENEFNQKYLDATENKYCAINKDLIDNCEQFTLKYPYLPNPLFSGFYNNLYDAFKFIYEIEIVLEQILYEGLSFNRADTLMNLCIFLKTASTYAMIHIDNDFSFAKKYSLADEIYFMAKNIYDSQKFIHATSTINLSLDQVITLTKFDDLESRLCCKYIHNGIAVLKLFHILAILQISPYYTDGVHKIAKKLIQSLREVLYGKRIVKLVVDIDTQGYSQKVHKTTRMKIYFAMGNSDRYCIRLDFPHEGENNIHLNINEPAHKQSTGFPFNEKEYREFIDICQDTAVFNKLFYELDDLYWFKSNYATEIKRIGKNDKDLEQALKDFQHKRGHIVLFAPDDDNLGSVSAFSEALAEAMTEYKEVSVYGSTDSEDDEFYKYILFQDYIFDTIIRVKNYEINNRIILGSNNYQLNSESSDFNEIKSLFCEYIREKIPQDEQLISYTNQDISLCDFLSKCLDRMDQMNI